MQPNYGRGAHHSFGDFPTDDQVMIIRNAVPIRVPNPEDILLGRGRPYQSHPGNKYMLQLIDSYRDKYQSSERREKHFIITEVLDIIQLRKGRFLMRVNYENYWVEVNRDVAYRKVGHAFRSKARISKGQPGDGEAETSSQEARKKPPQDKPTGSEQLPIGEHEQKRADEESTADESSQKLSMDQDISHRAFSRGATTLLQDPDANATQLRAGPDTTNQALPAAHLFPEAISTGTNVHTFRPPTRPILQGNTLASVPPHVMLGNRQADSLLLQAQQRLIDQRRLSELGLAISAQMAGGVHSAGSLLMQHDFVARQRALANQKAFLEQQALLRIQQEQQATVDAAIALRLSGGISDLRNARIPPNLLSNPFGELRPHFATINHPGRDLYGEHSLFSLGLPARAARLPPEESHAQTTEDDSLNRATSESKPANRR